MAQEKENKTYFKMADSFIDVANQHCDDEKSSSVASSMLFAVARFSAFVAATHADDRAQYEADIENATEFFSKEFKRMLEENLEEYKSVFDEAPRYQHLIKKNGKQK